MKYIHIYEDWAWCESEVFKGTPNTIELTDEEYYNIGKTLKIENGAIVEMTEEEIAQAQKEETIEE